MSPSGEMEYSPVTVEDIEDLLSEHRPVAATNAEKEYSYASESKIREEQLTNAIQPTPSLKDTRRPSYLQNAGEQTVSNYSRSQFTEGQGTPPVQSSSNDS